MESRLSVFQYPSPVIAAAIHDGHWMDDEFRALSLLSEHQRMQEEDPYTDFLTDLPVNRIVVEVSRFQTDLNRPREKALYLKPEDAWGLQLWKNLPTEEMQKKALVFYDGFYEQMGFLLKKIIGEYGGFVLLDIHSYNHRRQGPEVSAPEQDNPEINLGTAYNREKWRPLTALFMASLAEPEIQGKHPDVRENIKFKGGWLSQWVNAHYGHAGCVFSVEFKKTFMDEWTGRVDIDHLLGLKKALTATLPLLNSSFKVTKISTI
ncbi:N-formylglutamate amidohydrolase [bacterium A37T11]|nr:N-formylglutamate amidohydrolase [bacterium A37T11]